MTYRIWNQNWWTFARFYALLGCPHGTGNTVAPDNFLLSMKNGLISTPRNSKLALVIDWCKTTATAKTLSRFRNASSFHIFLSNWIQTNSGHQIRAVSIMFHDRNVILSAMVSPITGGAISCSTVCHWPLLRESTGDRWIPSQRAGNAEDISIRNVVMQYGNMGGILWR